MRRYVAAVIALGAAVSLSALADPALADRAGGDRAEADRTVADRTATGPSTSDVRVRAQTALHTAHRVLGGADTRTDPSMAMLRLRLTMDALPTADRRRAAAILARPTDHPDFYGQTYSVRAEKKCSGHICIHWVPTTRDAPPGKKWVRTMLRMMNNVWSFEVGKLGYRPPISDGTRGGGGAGMFDVYLKELYHQGLYGLTVAEQRSPSNQHLYSSYLVIDNDFKRSQFHADPMQVARVTAAHEFFHAIQYGYDAGEDPWLMESSATWMEDQFDDSSNDNRQYLPWSQLRRPGTPLDTFDNAGFEQYGNWLFFEYLSEHYGRGVVKSVWNHAASFPGGGHQYSAAAIRSALRRHNGMTKVFGRYASGNTVPAHTYAEGHHFPATAPPRSTVTLTRSAPSTPWRTYRVSHLASVDLTATPGADLTGASWGLRVKIDGPSRSKSPAVVVLVKRKHRPLTQVLVHLSKTGAGHITVPFARATTRSVTVTLANASTRFRCGTGGGYSCNGTSKAAHPTFAVRLSATRS